MIKCRSPRSLVLGIGNLLWFLVRSEYAISGRSDKEAPTHAMLALAKAAKRTPMAKPYSRVVPGSISSAVDEL